MDCFGVLSSCEACESDPTSFSCSEVKISPFSVIKQKTFKHPVYSAHVISQVFLLSVFLKKNSTSFTQSNCGWFMPPDRHGGFYYNCERWFFSFELMVYRVKERMCGYINKRRHGLCCHRHSELPRCHSLVMTFGRSLFSVRQVHAFMMSVRKCGVCTYINPCVAMWLLKYF